MAVVREVNRYPIDVENVEEMNRLAKQAQLVTQYTGLCPAEIEPKPRQEILDIGCGPGEWVLDIARKHPGCQVTGLDISQRMIDYASTCTYVHRLTNTHFIQGDACKPLPFPDLSFDMIHSRFITSFLVTPVWPIFLLECYRLLRPGGVICNTEVENMGTTNSPALAAYSSLLTCYQRKGQHCFNTDGPYSGISAAQGPLLRKVGFDAIQQKAKIMDFSVGTSAFSRIVDDYATMMVLLQPALLREKIVEEEKLTCLHTQVLAEMHMDTFHAIETFYTVWGYKPI